MSAFQKTATELAILQEHLERATARCIAAARHTDDAHHTATAAGTGNAIADAEDVRVAIASLQQTLSRALVIAEATADIVRAVIHGTPKSRASERPEVPAPIPDTP
ncbi:MAG TPA: hypothetical protein VHJ83_17285 [Micromonosporaceae bacterium]|jgi:hypothetical protein|nr:hypothetical protein [Micromonosporaceae bacterium]